MAHPSNRGTRQQLPCLSGGYSLAEACRTNDRPRSRRIQGAQSDDSPARYGTDLGVRCRARRLGGPGAGDDARLHPTDHDHSPPAARGHFRGGLRTARRGRAHRPVPPGFYEDRWEQTAMAFGAPHGRNRHRPAVHRVLRLGDDVQFRAGDAVRAGQGGARGDRRRFTCSSSRASSSPATPPAASARRTSHDFGRSKRRSAQNSLNPQELSFSACPAPSDRCGYFWARAIVSRSARCVPRHESVVSKDSVGACAPAPAPPPPI